MGEVPPFHVFTHIADKVFDSHLGGSISYRWESEAHFLWWLLDSLLEQNGEEAGCLSQGSIEYAPDLGELSFVKDCEVFCVVFGFEELFYHERVFCRRGSISFSRGRLLVFERPW